MRSWLKCCFPSNRNDLPVKDKSVEIKDDKVQPESSLTKDQGEIIHNGSDDQKVDEKKSSQLKSKNPNNKLNDVEEEKNNEINNNEENEEKKRRRSCY
jgi:hypothetical protein